MGKGEGYFTGYPKCVFCILANEFCERFSFYGMKAILVLYLNRALLFSEDDSTVIYHAFNMLCYFMPIFGAMIADGWLGKYKTILYISMVYALGNIVMSVTAIPFNGEYIRWGCFVGLALIAFGTGGIKPCVSSFGGDQFSEDQKRQKESFFSIFYMSINIGSLFSTILTPYLRSEVYCFDDNCYCLAFGVPAILMIIAIIIFVGGTKYYKQTPPGENVIGKMFGCIGVALKGKMSCSSEEKRDHWLDFADHKYEDAFIADLKDVLRICWLFIPLPVFWALFEQQGSRWTLQAGQMDGDFGSFVLQPDQIHAINPLLVIVLVPLLESAIFPCLNKLKIPNRPLQRMCTGMFLAGLAFVFSGFLQLTIDNNIPQQLQTGMVKFKVANAVHCPININTDVLQTAMPQIEMSESSDYYEVPVNEGASSLSLIVSATGTCISGSTFQNQQFSISDTEAQMLIISQNSMFMAHHDKTDRTMRGDSTIRIVNTLDSTIDVDLMANGGQESKPHEFYNILSKDATEEEELLFADFDVLLKKQGNNIYNDTNNLKLIGEYQSRNGAVSTLIIQRDDSSEIIAVQHIDVTSNEINIFWQVPQYFILTLGECLFSVTGLSFAYTQAPVSMKAVLQAIWLLTSAFGNLIVIIVAEAGGSMSQMAEFFMFAGLMFVTVVIYAIMCVMYTYVTPRDAEEMMDKPEKTGADNEGFDKTVDVELNVTQSEKKQPLQNGDAGYTVENQIYDDTTKM